jgi:transposase
MDKKIEVTDLENLDQASLIGIILELRELVQVQAVEIQKLKEQVAKNSGNSSKPPSSDGLKKPKTKSLREKGQRKTGGQKGHEGKTLCMVSEPEKIVHHCLETCPDCAHDLGKLPLERLEKRQVFDIPPIHIEVTEHQAEVKKCPCCGKVVKASFPKGVENQVQYGAVLKAQIAYLSTYQLLPTARLAELIADFYGQSLSEDTVLRVLATLAEAVHPSLEAIQAELLNADLLHADETGLRVAGKTEWLHVLSNAKLSYYALDPKRGQVALRKIGLIPEFKGTLVHDAYASYWVFEQCQHALCNAHILRELRFLHEEQAQTWAGELKTLLLEMKKAVAAAQASGQLQAQKLTDFVQAYERLLAQGWLANPPPQLVQPPKRGRLKQSTAQNLLQRLGKYQTAILAFIHDFRVPFDNNLAERDLRMMKVKQKISGAFRTQLGAEIFAKLRSYISTVRKQGINVIAAIHDALLGQPFIPPSSLGAG